MPNIWLMQCQLLTCTVVLQCAMAVVGLWVILLNSFNWIWLKRELKTNVNTVGFGFVVWEGIINWNSYTCTFLFCTRTRYYVLLVLVSEKCANIKVHSKITHGLLVHFFERAVFKFIFLHCRTVKSYVATPTTPQCFSSSSPNHHTPVPPSNFPSNSFSLGCFAKLYNASLISKGTHELRGYNSSPTVHCNFHITNFTVNFL